MGHIIGKNRNQIEIVSLDELVEAESPARQIDKLIDEADTSYFEKSETKATGRPPYNPKDMLKLYVYGMDNGVVSSRKLDRECRRNVELMWLLKGLQPDDKTICNFRCENAEKLKTFFNEFCKTLAKAGYIDGKIVAIDGTKIRANNSRRNNYSAKKLERSIEHIDRKITEYMQELDKNDKVDELNERRAKYVKFKESIENGEVSEVSTTDPDSRLMRSSNGGADVSFNAQAAVDGKNKLVTGFDVINEPNDQGQLHKLAKKVKDNLDLKEMTVLGDKGYYDTEDIKDCHKDNIRTIVAVPGSKNPDRGLDFRKEDFHYDKEKDEYICPAGCVLKFVYEEERGIRRYRSYKACNKCPMKSRCCKGNRREITRHKYAEYAEQNDKDFAENQELYKLRQQLSEHPFGTIKRTMGIRQFLTRGLKSVTAEAALIFLVYNLKRLRVIHKHDNKKDGQTAQNAQFICLFMILITLYLLNGIQGNLTK